MKRMFCLVILMAVVFSGCTVRGGWPRFLRKGESWGWNGARPDQVKPPLVEPDKSVSEAYDLGK